MSLTQKERELVSLGASLAAGCRLCANSHFRAVRRAGASDEEIEQAMSEAIAVRDRAADIMKRHGLKLLGRKTIAAAEGGSEDSERADATRMTELVSIAAAFAVNCTASVKNHVAAARAIGVPDDEIDSVVNLPSSSKERRTLSAAS